MQEPVDAVITWVDGNDPAHAAKLAAYLRSEGISRPQSAAPTRYNQCGELDFCVRALLQFAPWIRTIYIVTDGQVPAIMQQLLNTVYEKKIKLIDHRQIFAGFESCLPTFNSLTIETVLWRIPGLANQFIYLNDDCIMIRPVVYTDFFRGESLVVRGCWKKRCQKKIGSVLRKWLGFKPPKVAEHRLLQEKSAQMAGFASHFFDLPHVPFPLHKTTMAAFFRQYPHYLCENVNYALRDRQQFWTISLALHLDINDKKVIYDESLAAIMVNGGHHPLQKIKYRLAQADKQGKVAFICMQSIDAAPEATQKFMLEWLNKRINAL